MGWMKGFDVLCVLWLYERSLVESCWVRSGRYGCVH